MAEGEATLVEVETWLLQARDMGFPDRAPVRFQFQEARATWWAKSVSRPDR